MYDIVFRGTIVFSVGTFGVKCFGPTLDSHKTVPDGERQEPANEELELS